MKYSAARKLIEEPITLTDNERLAWIQLIRNQNVGPKTFFQLLEIYGTAQDALKALPEMAKRGGKKAPLQTYSKSDAQKELDDVSALGGQILTLADEVYPTLLKHISDPPPIISVLGNIELLNRDSIAIVGARNASINACRLTAKFAKELGDAGYVISSGLARGIDTAAHTGSLETGTIAVVAGGIDIIYPKENAELYDSIRQGGAIIAECAYGTVPQPKNFPRRNRIISGLCLGTLIVEAAKRSGSLITARMANEQGREVMAIPGFPLDPRAEGPNHLIQQGATLINNVDEIIQTIKFNDTHNNLLNEDIGPLFTHASAIPPPANELDRVRSIILSQLNNSEILVDDLIAECACGANIIMTILLELELAGNLQRHAGGKVSLLIDE